MQNKSIYTVLGLMSGTSMDGIDAAILETDGENHIKLISTASLDYGKLTKPEILEKTTQLHAEIISELLKNNKNIDLIGYHGQATYHNPAEKISIQIGEPQYLANKFNIPVIFNFRQNDIQHGGQGAPLAPLYHLALAKRDKLDNLAVINIGGIANISLISHHKILAGFDTGPGNILLNQFVSHKTHNKYLYDQDGKFAQQGKINLDIIKILFSQTSLNNYYEKKYPKSLDIKDIIYPEILNTLDLYDGCATLAAFTAYTISQNIPESINHIILCGGGAKNLAIINALKNYLPKNKTIKTADDIGWSTTYMEAELIAWLAVRSLKKLPLSIPETTGVSEPVTGGEIFYPDSKSL